MCDARLPGPSALACTLPAPHPGYGCRFEAEWAADGTHDDNEVDR